MIQQPNNPTLRLWHSPRILAWIVATGLVLAASLYYARLVERTAAGRALVTSVQKGDVEGTRDLLAAGANPNITDAAARESPGFWKILKRLFRRSDPSEETPVLFSAFEYYWPT